MDTRDIAQEIDALKVEIGTLEARKANVLARRCDLPMPDLQGRLELIENRVVEIEPVALEHNQLLEEGERLRVMIAARAEIASDLSRTERRIESLQRRLQIILDLAARAGVDIHIVDA